MKLYQYLEKPWESFVFFLNLGKDFQSVAQNSEGVKEKINKDENIQNFFGMA